MSFYRGEAPWLPRQRWCRSTPQNGFDENESDEETSVAHLEVFDTFVSIFDRQHDLTLSVQGSPPALKLTRLAGTASLVLCTVGHARAQKKTGLAPSNSLVVKLRVNAQDSLVTNCDTAQQLAKKDRKMVDIKAAITSSEKAALRSAQGTDSGAWDAEVGR